MKKKRRGYVLTFEVMMTLALMSMFLNLTVDILLGFNCQRFVHTVGTSTIIQMAKWGGYESNAYKANGIDYDIIESANNELDNYLPKGYSAEIIHASPKVVSKNGEEVVCIIEYTFPNFLFLDGIKSTNTLEFRMNSIMGAGELLS